MSNIENTNLEGEVIDGRYKLGPLRGKGVMGVVYEAEHILMKKRVAIKMLHPSQTRAREVVQRFRQEAQATANIEHPNICSATDFGMYDSQTYYLVMELLDGKSLAEIMEIATIGSERAIHITKQILSALQEAHKIGVVHRDLKPENILIVERGGDPDFAKITDFGIAQVRLFNENPGLTQAGAIYGTPFYMSPEQAKGINVDHRADLYSIGVMLYEMLMGRVPFNAPSTNVILSMHVFGPPQPFIEVQPEHDIEPKFEALVMKLLEKEPKDRFQSAIEVYDALSEIQTQEESPPRVVSPATSALTVSYAGGGNLKSKNETLGFGLLKAIRKYPVLLAIPVLLIVLITILIFVSASRKKPREIDLSKERAQFLKSENLESLETRSSTEPRIAVKELELFIKKTPDAPHLHFLLGKALLKRRKYEESIKSFENAVVLKSEYIKDSALLDYTFTILELKRSSDADYASAFVLSSLKEIATVRLTQMAEHHPSEKVRKRGLELLNKAGLLANLEKWNQLTISLRHSESCEESRALIVEISELGDPKTLGSLWRFSSNPRSGCKGTDCWECARKDVRIAIERLSAK